jgi:molecular chaperone IbpA
MSAYDFTPLYRTLVGFDRIAGLLDQASRLDATPGYPPFNIEQTSENTWHIELAVAGFSQSEISIEVKENLLTISGKRAEPSEGVTRKFVHRGIAERSFERRFQLADHVRVEGARLENGLLCVDLVREIPEAAKPRKIAITGASDAKSVDSGPVDSGAIPARNSGARAIDGAKKGDTKAA